MTELSLEAISIGDDGSLKYCGSRQEREKQI